jgi:hypothetical protein
VTRASRRTLEGGAPLRQAQGRLSRPRSERPRTWAVAFRAPTRPKQRKRKEFFAKRNERFRDEGRKSLRSLGGEIMDFARLFAFNGLIALLFRALAACALSIQKSLKSSAGGAPLRAHGRLSNPLRGASGRGPRGSPSGSSFRQGWASGLGFDDDPDVIADNSKKGNIFLFFQISETHAPPAVAHRSHDLARTRPCPDLRLSLAPE